MSNSTTVTSQEHEMDITNYIYTEMRLPPLENKPHLIFSSVQPYKSVKRQQCEKNENLTITYNRNCNLIATSIDSL